MGDSRDIDLPFEQLPDGGFSQELDADVLLSSGFTVAATVVTLGDQVYPALLFRFLEPDLIGTHPPILLIQSDEHMAKARPLIQGAIAAARRAATIARAQKRPE